MEKTCFCWKITNVFFCCLVIWLTRDNASSFTKHLQFFEFEVKNCSLRSKKAFMEIGLYNLQGFAQRWGLCMPIWHLQLITLIPSDRTSFTEFFNAINTYSPEMHQSCFDLVFNLFSSFSDTSRTKSADEVDGQDYHFISCLQFEQDILARRFVKHGEYKGSYYGFQAFSYSPCLMISHARISCSNYSQEIKW